MDKLPKSGQLNLVPFIDIMLVLLCIVLSVSSFIATGKIKIDLPNSSAKAEQQDNQKKFVIEVDKNNDLFIDGKKSDHDALNALILDLDKTSHIQLRVDKDASFNSFVQIIDLLKQKNHENFSIATRTQ